VPRLPFVVVGQSRSLTAKGHREFQMTQKEMKYLLKKIPKSSLEEDIADCKGKESLSNLTLEETVPYYLSGLPSNMSRICHA
jgi:hypothetical protein